MPSNNQPEQRFPVPFTRAQRKVIAELAPELADRLRLTEADQRAVPLTGTELRAIREKAGESVRLAATGMKRNSLRHVADLTAKALDRSRGIGAIPVSSRLYQFKVTLRDVTPAIWRRIQVKDCTLDKLHERIQTAMGWTNSHLHHFRIGEQLYGDPLLQGDNFVEMGYEDSTVVKLGEVVPKAGTRFVFEYEYDFGDCWRHEVVFERRLKAEPGRKYQLCLEGNGTARPRTWVERRATRSFWTPSPTPITSDTTSILTGSAGRSTRRSSTRRRPPGGCTGGCPTGGGWCDAPRRHTSSAHCGRHMISLHRDPHFTFRFDDARIIPRFHLDGVEPGTRVSVFAIGPVSGDRLGLLATTVVGNGGWVDLPQSLVVRAGAGFVVVV